MSHKKYKHISPERREKMETRDHKVEHCFRWVLHQIERIIAIVTLGALLWTLALEVHYMFTVPNYFAHASDMLHNLLTIVVGLEFVRMLIDTTPANILEVLTVAITRQIVLNHSDPWADLALVACIAGLFAIRRFLIRRSELQEEMVEIE